MIPVISLVGTSNSGKTTLLLKIIQELKARNYKIATIKHHHAEIDIDQPGKDTYRHAKAGADQVVLVTPNKATFFHQFQEEPSLDEIIEKISGVDIIITEGFKKETRPKIEVLREETRKSLISKPEELVAVVSNMAFEELKVPRFDLDDAAGITNFIVKRFIRD